MPVPDAVVFDLGNVLVDWDPRHLYRKLFAGDEAKMEWFLAHVCNNEWNRQQDGGRPFAEGVRSLCALWPDHAALIRAYHERWEEMMPGAIDGTVAIVVEVSGGAWSCTGTLIGPRLVTTAAHCLLDDNNHAVKASAVTVMVWATEGLRVSVTSGLEPRRTPMPARVAVPNPASSALRV